VCRVAFCGNRDATGGCQRPPGASRKPWPGRRLITRACEQEPNAARHRARQKVRACR
jgi:hypothetical protein